MNLCKNKQKKQAERTTHFDEMDNKTAEKQGSIQTWKEEFNNEDRLGHEEKVAEQV